MMNSTDKIPFSHHFETTVISDNKFREQAPRGFLQEICVLQRYSKRLPVNFERFLRTLIL